jgi:hypothetical protein
MTESEEVSGCKRQRSEDIKRLPIEFETSGLRQNEFCREHRLALSRLQRQLKKRRLDHINSWGAPTETLERNAGRCKQLPKR